jgi:hypothetical protein
MFELKPSQVNAKCEFCRENIAINELFAWIHVKHKNAKGNEIIAIKRACARCAEKFELEEKYGNPPDYNNVNSWKGEE